MSRQGLIRVTALLLSMWATSALAAGGLPDWYPRAHAQWGVITGLDIAQGRIDFGDISIRVDPGARVYTPSTQFETLHSLRPGTRIAFGRDGGRSPGAVTEIWVLPEGYTPSRTPARH